MQGGTSALYSAGGDALDYVLLEEGEESHRREDSYNGRGRHDMPANGGVTEHGVYLEGQGVVLGIRQQEKGDDKLIVGIDEHEDCADSDTGAADGQDYPCEDVQIVAAVNGSRLVKTCGESFKIALENGGDQSHIESGINQYKDNAVIEKAEGVEHLVERRQYNDTRHHLGEHQGKAHGLAPSETVLCQHVCRRNGKAGGDKGSAAGVEEAVEHVAAYGLEGLCKVGDLKIVGIELGLQHIGVGRERHDHSGIHRQKGKHAEYNAQYHTEHFKSRRDFFHIRPPPYL